MFQELPEPICFNFLDGAGIFSSVSRWDDAEYQRRLASQRIIVGSWLLMKESCAAMASVLTAKENIPGDLHVNQAGVLLISTLTSLKHTGAAYAAHTALQQIAQLSMQHKQLHHLPAVWVDRLLGEITKTDKVRDSTLRRSTGWVLGFLSIMRSEVICRKLPRPLCRRVVQNILHLAMPSDEWLSGFLEVVYGVAQPEGVFPLLREIISEKGRVVRGEYSVRSRVHALNVLRMIVLDSPLTQDIYPFIGDAIATAIVGYVDPDWGVRNSSTMVFSACLLRIVDADKNAANSEAKSSNAISIAELFRLYPNLPAFFAAILVASLSGRLQVVRDLPPILPILILLYRLQPSRASGQDSVARFDPFVPLVTKCLCHGHLSIRKAAARALGNMASSNRQSPSSLWSILERAFDGVQRRDCWNNVHGCLLVISEISQTVPCSIDALQIQTLIDMLPLDVGPKVPPICSSEVLHILRCFSLHDSDARERLMTACFLVLSTDSCTLSNPFLHVGRPELYRVASCVATDILVSTISLAIKEPRELAEKEAEKLASLLQSTQSDARVAAVKAFKKRIYDLVDQVLALSAHNKDVSEKVLRQLVDVILSALAAEVARSGDSVSAHPPTLRRLSRCLLECTEAGFTLRPQESVKPYLQVEGIGEVLWRLHRQRGADGMTGPSSDDENATNLLGNAVELMSLAPHPFLQADTMVDLVQHLSSMTMPWRLRYSAAVVARRLISTDNLPEQVKTKVWSTFYTLLQDADDDVRYVASLTVNFYWRSSSSPAPVPEHTLTGFGVSKFMSASFFLGKLRRLGLDAQGRAMVLSTELLESVREGQLDTVQNIGTDRKIFEEEEPNSYSEVALDFQVALKMQMIADTDVNTRDSDETNAVAEECLELCRNISLSLSELPVLLVSRMTRSNALFSGLHSLLLGCAALSFMGFGADKSSNEHLTILCKGNCHPLIINACQVLRCSKEGVNVTSNDIIKNCFLLP